MKRQQATLFVIALAVFTLIGAACGGSEPKSSSSSEPKSSPSDVWKAGVTAWKKGDVEGYMKTITKNGLEGMRNLAREKGFPRLEDFLKGSMEAYPDLYLPETRNEKINGDTATLEAKSGKGDWDEISFVKEDGEWKRSK